MVIREIFVIFGELGGFIANLTFYFGNLHEVTYYHFVNFRFHVSVREIFVVIS